jgi:hypothetical protein
MLKLEEELIMDRGTVKVIGLSLRQVHFRGAKDTLNLEGVSLLKEDFLFEGHEEIAEQE